MANVPYPPKPAPRDVPERRSREQRPAPTPDEIRRQLGWGLTVPDFRPAPERS
jgi:hypothetical protein